MLSLFKNKLMNYSDQNARISIDVNQQPQRNKLLNAVVFSSDVDVFPTCTPTQNQHVISTLQNYRLHGIALKIQSENQNKIF